MELDRQVIQAITAGDVEEAGRGLRKYAEMKVILRKQTLSEPVISVKDEVAKDALRKIIEGDSFTSDQLWNRLHMLTGEEISLHDLSDAEIDELGSEIFYSWYSHHEYISAHSELRPLILHCDVSDSVKRLVRQVKDCYAFQQFDAAFGLCRTLLEASIRDICAREKELFPNKSEEDILYGYISWDDLREEVCTGRLNEKLICHYRELNKVLHARRKETTARHVHEAFRETLLMIEELYGLHRL